MKDNDWTSGKSININLIMKLLKIKNVFLVKKEKQRVALPALY
jgi:hypothetical protein